MLARGGRKGQAAVIWLGFITIAALIEYMVLGALVGQMRVKTGIAAPATTGDPVFERYFRVHQNTLEALVIFIPGLWLFAQYVSLTAAILLGVVFIGARAYYAISYIKDPAARTIGAIATFAVNAILVIGSLLGLIVFALV
jgi:glutathione S-transferase